MDMETLGKMKALEHYSLCAREWPQRRAEPLTLPLAELHAPSRAHPLQLRQPC